MSIYYADTLADGKTTYYLIRLEADGSILPLQTKYLKHKMNERCSSNTVQRIAYTIAFYMNFLAEQELSMEPPILDRCVEWNGKYYIVGNPKMDIQKSKTENDNTLVLTMAGLAEKMKQEHITTANVRLGIGLPLTRMGAEKEDYANYMLRNRRLSFKYEGKSYSIFLVSVDGGADWSSVVLNEQCKGRWSCGRDNI